MSHPKKFARRSIYLAAILGACVIASQAQDRLARIDWLSRNTSPIRSIDPTITDDDFTDLKPIMKAIGNSRIVVLGEESHGDGATFLAKVRLIKFLHQKMGFDVLAWEAGLFNCQEMDAAVRNPEIPIQKAMSLGIYPIWATSAQVQPVFEYARSVAHTGGPLEMTGFDHQFSGSGGPGIRWRDAMMAFIDKADPSILPQSLRSSLINDTALVFNASTSPANLRAIKEKWKALPAVLDNSRTKLEAVHGIRYARLMRRTADDAVISIEGLARFRESGGEFKSADNNIRDLRMAENLIWLANERYKGRRIIVWAAAFHTLYDPSAIKLDADSGFSYQDVVTMGEVAQKSLGRDIYTICFTAARGLAGNPMGSQTVEFETPKDGSLEDLWTHTGQKFSFMDFRMLPANHWLHQPLAARLLQYSPIETDWTRQVDAVVFTREMFPSSAGPLAPDKSALTMSTFWGDSGLPVVQTKAPAILPGPLDSFAAGYAARDAAPASDATVPLRRCGSRSSLLW
jgi:erythromycin esterase